MTALAKMKLYFAVAVLAPLPVLSRQGGYDDYGYSYVYGYSDEDPYGGGIYDDNGYGGYDDSYGGYTGGNEGAMDYNDVYNDFYGYYQDADNEYYDYYGYYADDKYGYGDDYYYEDADVDDCLIDPADPKNRPIMAEDSVSCDIKIEIKQGPEVGAAAADIDGIYKLESCYNTKPLYRRENSPPGQERTLWFHPGYGEWSVSKGSELPLSWEDALMSGGDMRHVSSPVFVTEWYIQAPSEGNGKAFEASNVDVTCADGSTPKKDPKPITSKVTGLSPEEMEAKYMWIYSNMEHDDELEDVEHGLHNVNTMLVVLMVLFGLTLVLIITYFFVERRSGARSEGSERVAGGGSMHEPGITSFPEASQGQNLINLEEGTSSGSGPAPAAQIQPQAYQVQNLKDTTFGPTPQPPTQPQGSTLQLL